MRFPDLPIQGEPEDSPARRIIDRESQPGLLGESAVVGVLGRSNAGRGVKGESVRGIGVEGTSEREAGVRATSLTGNGVEAVSQSGVAVFAKSTQGRAAVFEGNIEVRGDIDVSGDVRLTSPGGDCAEDFDVADLSSADPGNVMVLDESGRLAPSYRAYDKRVVGVVSGAGSYRPGIVLDRHADVSGRRAIGLVGKVYCRVDAKYGPIETGDLLTTSPTPGHAMKVDDPGKAFGAVIGKALGPRDEGTGLVPMLIALQ